CAGSALTLGIAMNSANSARQVSSMARDSMRAACTPVMGRASREEPLDLPARITSEPVPEAVVELVVSVLPELVRVGDEAIRAPALRPGRRGAPVAATQVRHWCVRGGAGGCLRSCAC